MPDGTFLAFDYGRKRIGVAVGQSYTGSANPLTQIIVDNGKCYWNAIESLIQEWRPQAMIVGLPLNMDETASSISRAATQFARQLETRFERPVYLVDERLSSREARFRLEELQGNKRYSKMQLNSVAAQIILETWLNENK